MEKKQKEKKVEKVAKKKTRKKRVKKIQEIIEKKEFSQEDKEKALKLASLALQTHIEIIEPQIKELCKMHGGLEIEEIFGFIKPKDFSIKENTVSQ